MKPSVALLALLVASATANAKVKKPRAHEREAEPVAAIAQPFDPEEAVRQIRARMSGVRACYERASRTDSSLRGKLQLGFDIAETGQVAATQIELNGLRVDADWGTASLLTSCIRTQALGWRLSPESVAGGAHVSYVFVFEEAQAYR
ncbi:MAG TPA: AgmX/PglI C-terminal domain-containing protein [Polyangia bacterium]|nr:AgmX/PglI C-terminal domain-containing protein [Polyangia bacterium]